jgi:hypothetical protein
VIILRKTEERPLTSRFVVERVRGIERPRSAWELHRFSYLPVTVRDSGGATCVPPFVTQLVAGVSTAHQNW